MQFITLRQHVPDGKIHVYVDKHLAVCGGDYTDYVWHANRGPLKDEVPTCGHCIAGLCKVLAQMSVLFGQLKDLVRSTGVDKSVSERS